MTIDSNILIAYLNGEEIVVDTLHEWKRAGLTLFISSITFSEILSLSALTSSDLEKARSFLSGFISIPFDNEVGESAAYLRRLYTILLPDAGIAATALNLQVPLVTRDRGFQKIKELQIVVI